MDGYRLKAKPSKQYKAKLRTSRKKVVAASSSDDDDNITIYCISRSFVLLYTSNTHCFAYVSLSAKPYSNLAFLCIYETSR